MVKIIAGLMGGSVASGAPAVSSPDSLRALLSLLQKHNVSSLDTARVYNSGKSEETLGEVPSSITKDFTIATKAPGFTSGSLAYDKIIANCEASLKALQKDKIDLYYFHGPDRHTPLEDSCRAIHELHQRGKIGAFGVSNFRVDEVESIHDLCTKNGWITPSVYQGGYNPFARGAETRLFPKLRKLGMSFYAYSPLAGGFFSKTTEQLRGTPTGRMEAMSVFQNMYVNETSLALHERLSVVCEQEGVGMQAATLRWLVHHSALKGEVGDGLILGASSEAQMEQNLVACEVGPLPEAVVREFERLWREWSEEERNEARMFYSV